MITMHCDRCGREIEGTTYYTIRIYANDIEPSKDGSVSTDTASQNVATNSTILFNLERPYCEHCRDKIESVMYSKG